MKYLNKSSILSTSAILLVCCACLFTSCNKGKGKNSKNKKQAEKAEIAAFEQQMKEKLDQANREILIQRNSNSFKKVIHGIEVFDSAASVPIPSGVKVHKIKDVVVDNWEGDTIQNNLPFIIANAESELKTPNEAAADGYTCFIQEKKIVYFPVEYDTVIFSANEYDGNCFYDCIPFAAYKAKNTIENMNYFYFLVQDPEVIHVDLYSSKTEKLLCNGNEADLFFGKGYKTNTETSNIIPKNTVWTVNREGGIAVNNYPYGSKIADLPNQTEVCQIEDSKLCFYDCIDGKYGYWIFVKVDEISGWIFTGVCQKK